MKTHISYFLLALTVLSVATTATAQTPVYDMDGNIIFTGRYYVLPFVRGQGGGLTLGRGRDKQCPLDVVQESSEIDEGLPIEFSNWMSGVEFVPTNSYLNIETKVAATICMQPTYWFMDMFIGSHMDHWYLTTGAKAEEVGEDWYNSLFIIKETEEKYVYKFMNCPLSMPFCGVLGSSVDENGVRRLGLSSNEPFLVQFKKANVIESVLSKNM